jgi:hypothetical protein
MIVGHGNHKHADSGGWGIISIPLMKKASLNVQWITSRRNGNFMTVFHAKERNAN